MSYSGRRAASGERENHISVYRIVDLRELTFLQATGHYGSNPNRSGKYFALTQAGAYAFAAAPMNAGCKITATTLPLLVLQRGLQFHDPGAYGAAPSVFFAEQHLPNVYVSLVTPWTSPEEH